MVAQLHAHWNKHLLSVQFPYKKTAHKLQYWDNKHWKILHLMLDLIFLSFSNPNPTHSPKHQTLIPWLLSAYMICRMLLCACVHGVMPEISLGTRSQLSRQNTLNQPWTALKRLDLVVHEIPLGKRAVHLKVATKWTWLCSTTYITCFGGALFNTCRCRKVKTRPVDSDPPAPGLNQCCHWKLGVLIKRAAAKGGNQCASVFKLLFNGSYTFGWERQGSNKHHCLSGCATLRSITSKHNWKLRHLFSLCENEGHCLPLLQGFPNNERLMTSVGTRVVMRQIKTWLEWKLKNKKCSISSLFARVIQQQYRRISLQLKHFHDVVAQLTRPPAF